jgi:hypothetical protein
MVFVTGNPEFQEYQPMVTRKLLLGVVFFGLSARQLAAEPFAPIAADQFYKLHRLIKPQPGESRFQDIPWLLSVWEGRQKAAAEGKPMLVWAGGWGVPIGVC